MDSQVMAALIGGFVGGIFTLAAAFVTRAGAKSPSQSINNSGVIYGPVTNTSSTTTLIHVENIIRDNLRHTSKKSQTDNSSWEEIALVFGGALIFGALVCSWPGWSAGVLIGVNLGMLLNTIIATSMARRSGFPLGAHVTAWVVAVISMVTAILCVLTVVRSSLQSATWGSLNLLASSATQVAWAEATSIFDYMFAFLLAPVSAIVTDGVEGSVLLAVMIAATAAAAFAASLLSWKHTLEWTAACRLASGTTQAVWKEKLAAHYLTNDGKGRMGLVFSMLVLAVVSGGGLLWMIDAFNLVA